MKWVVLFIRIWELPGSYFGRYPALLTGIFSSFPQSLQENCQHLSKWTRPESRLSQI